jgi:hypothetical protein
VTALQRPMGWTLEQSISMLGEDHASGALMAADLQRAAEYLDERVAHYAWLQGQIAAFAARFWAGAS